MVRFKPNDISRKGTITLAQLVKFMIQEKQLVQDPAFDEELAKISNSGNFWVEKMNNPALKFPPAGGNEKNFVQPFFQKVMSKFTKLCSGNKKKLCTGNKIVFRAGPDGKYNVATKLGNVTCMPDASVHDAPTVGSRKPDVNIYYKSIETKGVLRIVSSWELKPRGQPNNHSFSPDEIGQLIDTNMELLRQQPFRTYTLAVLSDGVRFVFFKIIRPISHRDEYKVLQSSTYLNMSGWEIAFALLLQPPGYFGYKRFNMKGFNINKVIGQGAHTFVFEVSSGDDDPRVMKLFEIDEEYYTELENLNKLRDILQSRPEFAHVPKVDRALMVVTEAISGRKYKVIMSLPLCVPIRPKRGGKVLTRTHCVDILNTLEAVHAENLFNCDIKPSNVLMDGDVVVLCDWGSAVFARGNDPLPVRSVGTIGFCDFTLETPSIPNASHDLMALVRTVYANYTHQVVPSDKVRADAFWKRNFLKFSIWKKAMEYARDANYTLLKKVLMLL
eukprot:CAMPEP_0201114344 /NCGR_PEP_ID=MMETSP0812-20130820/78350_1 /ASSEMBLY_ACC=CAM_ASM_000668 /TAXON_ID=98059 /ORGANISM="Dinobryon sp., Strain UTEXLB2267" /LENGTH=499 /DNA_ID=CAMNT_0047377975 /DNA_START=426 /DNA_END=1926 /DNA_ORIENTATION=-